MEILSSVLARILQVITDFTSVVQFRHPMKLVGVLMFVLLTVGVFQQQ